jgi:hypothetical protein
MLKLSKLDTKKLNKEKSKYSEKIILWWRNIYNINKALKSQPLKEGKDK